MLAGKIERQGLVDILQLLAASRKSGVLKITGRINGEIYMLVGEVMSAKTGKLEGEEAFYEIFSLVKGRFKFTEEEIKFEKKITKTLTDLLIEASSVAQEFEKAKKTIPYEEAALALAPKPKISAESLSLSSQEWSILSNVDGKKSINEISKITGIPKTRVYVITARLKNLGLLETEDEDGARLRILFKKIVSPFLKLLSRKVRDKELEKITKNFNKWSYSNNIPISFDKGELKDLTDIHTASEERALYYLQAVKQLIKLAIGPMEKEEIVSVLSDINETLNDEEKKFIEKYKLDKIFPTKQREGEIEVWEQQIKKLEEKGWEGGVGI